MADKPHKNSWAGEVERRLAALERDSHVPFDFTDLVERLERLENAAGIRRDTGPCLSPAEQKAQGQRCGCRGADDNCPCQNVADRTTRAQREQAARPSEGPGRSEPAGDSARPNP